MRNQKILRQAVPFIVGSKLFRYSVGYFCPYCGYTGTNYTTLTAIELAEHILKEHKERFLDIIMGDEKGL